MPPESQKEGGESSKTSESRDGLGRFIREDLAPAVDEVSGGQAPTPEPELVFHMYYQGP
jgi:hypothetical protein